LIRVDDVDTHHLSIEFSEAMDTSAAHPVNVSINDTLADAPLKVWSIYPKLPSTTTFSVVTDRQDSTRGYLLKVRSGDDLVGLPIDPKADSLYFAGASVPDTLWPFVSSVSVQDSARGIELSPTILIQFSDAVKRDSLTGAISLVDTSRNEIPSTVDWLNDAACDLRPRGNLTGKTWYRLNILTYDASDWSGRRFLDSLKVVWFQTLDPENLSSVEGAVVDLEPATKPTQYVVLADQVESKSQKSYMTIAKQDGSFMIGGMEEGRYVLWVYRDRNFNRKYDPGQPVPYVGSERFNYAPDTLKLRARWPLEGVKIELK
jgi:hypothetical protein